MSVGNAAGFSCKVCRLFFFHSRCNSNRQESVFRRLRCGVRSGQSRSLADSLFAEIISKGTKNLVIDLRFNGGGNFRYGDYLLDYPTDNPIE